MSKETIRKQICAEIVRLLMEERKRLRVSGNSLAEKAGLSQSLISSLQTNPWNPTIDTLLRIADALKIDLGQVVSTATKNVQDEFRAVSEGGRSSAKIQ